MISPRRSAKLNLNIASAHIATFGEKVVDVFYVTDLTGGKITRPARQTGVRKALLEVIRPESGAGRPESPDRPIRSRRSGCTPQRLISGALAMISGKSDRFPAALAAATQQSEP